MASNKNESRHLCVRVSVFVCGCSNEPVKDVTLRTLSDISFVEWIIYIKPKIGWVFCFICFSVHIFITYLNVIFYSKARSPLITNLLIVFALRQFRKSLVKISSHRTFLLRNIPLLMKVPKEFAVWFLFVPDIQTILPSHGLKMSQ